VVFCDILKSKRGVPTEKGLLIFKIVPPTLVDNTSIPWGKHKLRFYFMDRENVCSTCSRHGHLASACPTTAFELGTEEAPSDADKGDKPKTGKGKTRTKAAEIRPAVKVFRRAKAAAASAG